MELTEALVWSWITFSITFDVNPNKVIGQWFNASVKEPFLYIDFSFDISQDSKSEIVLAKTFAPSFKKQSDRLSKPAAINTLVFFDGVFGNKSSIPKITLNNALKWFAEFKVYLFEVCGTFSKCLRPGLNNKL